MRDREYHGDDPDTAAKKVAEDLKEEGWRVNTNKSKVKDTKDTNNNKPKPKTYAAYKCSKNIPLAEEITVDNKNVFLQIINNEPLISPELDLKDQQIIIKPHDRSENTPVIPYTFKNVDEIKYFIERAKNETIHSLYFKSKSLWKCFVVAKDNDTIIHLPVDQAL